MLSVWRRCGSGIASGNPIVHVVRVAQQQRRVLLVLSDALCANLVQEEGGHGGAEHHLLVDRLRFAALII